MKAWVKGLLVAVISAGANAGAVFLGAATFGPELLHNGHFWLATAGAIGFAGLKTALGYLAKSPFPGVTDGQGA